MPQRGLLIAGWFFAAGLGFSAHAQQAPHALPADPSAQMDLSFYQGPKGTLAIRAVQGTKGGPAVSGDEAELILFHNNAPVKRYPLTLDARGSASVSDMPLAMKLRPMVRVRHAGVYYQQLGEPLDEGKPQASMDVLVYEVTETRPEWKIVLRQVVYDRQDDLTDVAETVIVENPTDRTWLGGPADAQGRRPTISLGLPPGASDVQLQRGFHGWCCTAFNNPELVVQMPLMPGTMTYQFGYSVHERDGQTDLRVASAAPIDHAVVYVPESDSVLQAVAIAPAGTEQVGGKPARLYQAKPLAANTPFGVTLAPLPKVPQTADAASSDDRRIVWVSAAGGAVAIGIIVLLAIKRVFLK
jgi:hypothetical protein